MKTLALRILSVAAVLLSSPLAQAGPAQAGDSQAAKPYQYARVGNQRDATPSTQGGLALMGGGSDLDDAFRFLCQHSGGGDFLILRAHGGNDYNPYVDKLCHPNSVATLIISSRQAAADPFVIGRVRQAEAIFIAGGDQANYLNFWRGTPLESTLNESILRGIPLGGTSAGLAVLGEYIYTAQNDKPDDPNLGSQAALANPFDHQVVLARGFLEIPLLKDTITDTHFVARNRLGRLLVFMARIRKLNLDPEIKAIAVDQGAAVLVDRKGAATVVGGHAYFLRTRANATALERNTPLGFGPIAVRKVAAGESFDLKNWSGGMAYTLSVEGGVIHSTQPGGSLY